MKEIKFRAWDKVNNRMLFFERLSWHDEYDLLYFSEGNIDVPVGDNIELMQYTGLKDKNGKEIYEGDILSFKKSVGEVWWQDSAGYWAIDFKPVPKCFVERDPTSSRICHSMEYEIIGNIYENPELPEDEE